MLLILANQKVWFLLECEIFCFKGQSLYKAMVDIHLIPIHDLSLSVKN